MIPVSAKICSVVAGDLGERQLHHFGKAGGGDDNDAVDVAEHHVAVLYADAVVELDGAAIVDDAAAQALVLGVAAGGKYREIQGLDAARSEGAFREMKRHMQAATQAFRRVG